VKTLQIGNYEFLAVEKGNARIMFSTAKADLNFNINEDSGKNNLQRLKKLIDVDEIGYLQQCHSSSIFNYDGNIHSGDALITNKKNTAIGVFTADCVPILMFDKKKQVVAAVHSGWKGTLDEIVLKTVIEMKKQYDCEAQDITAYIGPHNRGCCYEIGRDVESLFSSKDIYQGLKVIEAGKLNLEKCIQAQLKNSGVEERNIISASICTFCNEKYTLYSYRKHKEACGRMFSFIYLT
jgi:YfiH family protein